MHLPTNHRIRCSWGGAVCVPTGARCRVRRTGKMSREPRTDVSANHEHVGQLTAPERLRVNDRFLVLMCQLLIVEMYARLGIVFQFNLYFCNV